MSLVITRIELENFRKFRTRRTIEGLAPGLNVVVEPNETGKSTVLEALRGAFFMRHSAKTELTRSYCPIGDDVAPLVQVTFSVAGEGWHLTKQFLKGHKIELTAPNGSRMTSDEAEERLQHLLGFEKGSTRSFDADTLGALGLLWVGQASALGLEAPGRIVRETVHSALEAEVGTVVGGRAFDAVRKRVSDAYGELCTSTGRPTGRLAAANAELAVARSRLVEARQRNSEYEGHLAELEDTRMRLGIVERDVADPEEAALRERLVKDLDVARSARERLATRKAEHEVAKAESIRLQDALKRLDGAKAKAAEASEAKRVADDAVLAVEDERAEVVRTEKEARSALALTRTHRQRTARALEQGRSALNAAAKWQAYAHASDRRASLVELEAAVAELEPASKTGIDAATVKRLEDLERDVVVAKAALDAGATRIEIERHDGIAVHVDGLAVEGAVDATRETRIDVGTHATILVKPPSTGAGSVAAAYETAMDRLADALASAGVADAADARCQVEAARIAGQSLEAIRLKIATLCAADPLIALVAGADALKALDIPAAGSAADEGKAPDLALLEKEAREAVEEEDKSQIAHEVAEDALQEFEGRHRTLTLAQATADADHVSASKRLEEAEFRTPAEDTRAASKEATETLARADDALAEAERNASAFEEAAIQKRIESIDRARQTAEQRRTELKNAILRLELLINGEGAKGLTGLLADAVQEEAVAAEVADRLAGEAAVLKLLQDRLHDAHEEAARRFLGPVTRRASAYVKRILPGSELSFDEGLALSTVSRAGQREDCATLSRGTQEQLAVLTRLAFADLLRDRGAPVSLILDDPLVYSDDARLDAMTTLLGEASERMQVILFTCRERAFRHLEGNRIAL
ncbi:AAA family ATPase [Novosphingobium rosa]|uniref:AAA family ATPase n=1 Tax=Novosphingobium rosa TaxID=76978 RepID=UPI00082D73D5|nr:AAA family ATPase [Novosphingobium rosa]